MKSEVPKRIAIIGLPGSGKSTFACQLGSSLNIPVHHLDRHMFDGRIKRDRQEFLAIKELLVAKKFWIIEGCSLSTLEMRFSRADMIIYFHFSRLLCIWRLFKRLFDSDKTISSSGCLRGINWPLLRYVWNFDRDKRESIAELRKKYPLVEFIILRSPSDLDKLVGEFKRRKERAAKDGNR